MIFNKWPWKPKPDYTRLIDYLQRDGRPGYVPLLEFLIDPEIIQTLSDNYFPDIPFHGRTEIEKSLDRTMWTYYRLGYDALRAKPILDLPFEKLSGNDTALYSRKKRGWINEGSGPITCWQDLSNTPGHPGKALISASWRMYPDISPKVWRFLPKHTGFLNRLPT